MTQSGFEPAKIVAVIVLYRQTFEESVSVQTLRQAVAAADNVDCRVLVYDNTPSESDDEPVELPDGFRYQRAPYNRGLYGGYSAALAIAQIEGCEWLLTLDQDTELPPDFFRRLRRGLAAAQSHPKIATVVPHLEEGARALSPAYAGLGRARMLPSSFSGIPPREARAFNSAALLRVAAIEEIGGFHPCFWLDYLDNWLHHELYLRGWKMYVCGDLHIRHQLSILNYEERVSPIHYSNFLSAEGAFHDLYAPPWTRAAYALQLLVRLANQRRRRESVSIWGQTKRKLAWRLRTRRSDRLVRWRQMAGCDESDDTDHSEELS